MQLTKDQQLAYNLVLEGHNIFITGRAGTGKSFLIEKIANDFPCDVTATTGIAAINIKGTTIHRWGGYKPSKFGKDECYQKLDKWTEQRIIKCNMLIIDEISMMSGQFLDYINFTLKQIRMSHEPFGGIQIIFVGDFLQLPPVQKRNEPKKKFAFESQAWNESKFKNIKLNEIIRQKDGEFISFLDRVRDSKLTIEDKKMLMNLKPKYELDQYVKLYPLNTEVDHENLKKLNEINEKEFVFTASHSKMDICTDLQAKYFRSLFFQDSLFTEILTLKIGARVMMLTNTHIEKNIANGSVGTIIDFKNGLPLVEFDNGKTILIEKEKFEYVTQDDKTKQKKTMITINQIPLKLSWAITIHKSQGMTLDRVYCDMKSIFAPSQAYVALSRCKNLDGLAIDNLSPKSIISDKKALEFMNNEDIFYNYQSK